VSRHREVRDQERDGLLIQCVQRIGSAADLDDLESLRSEHFTQDFTELGLLFDHNDHGPRRRHG